MRAILTEWRVNPQGWAGFLGAMLAATGFLTLASYLALNSQLGDNYAPIYPESGIGLALLWRYGARFWPAVFISTTLLSNYLDSSWIVASGTGWLDVLMAMVVLHLLKRWRIQASLEQMRDLGGFVLAISIGTAISFPIYAFREVAVFADTDAQASALGIHYALATLFSYLILTPLLMVWRRGYVGGRRRAWLVGLSMAAIVLMGWVILSVGGDYRDRLLFVLLPFVIIAAIAGRVGGASAGAGLIVMMMMVLGGRVVVTLTDDALHTLFVITATLSGYLLAVVFNERERAVAEVDYRARHDLSTGLMNRYEFERHVEAALRDRAHRYALLYLDLDQFKLVNDTCGHLAGDRMLRLLGETLGQALPPGACLARLGGDEFGCLLMDATPEEVADAARRIHDAVGSVRFTVEGLVFTVGVSIGTTFLSPEVDHDPDDVLARADVACYTAKEQGRNRTHVYNPSDSGMRQRHAEMQDISQLRTALSGGHFKLHVQRILSLDGAAGDAEFFEVLLHYSDPKGTRAIEDMISAAQRYGLMAQVDRWVFEQAAKLLQRQSGRGLKLSVNVAATTLESDGFQEFVLDLPTRHAFRPEQMVVEITEAVAVKNLTRAVANLHELRRAGFGIALDDFGAGVASFGYLNQLPVTLVKIDGGFVRALGQDPAAEVIIGSLAQVAELRGIRCAAEWVEDGAVLPWLKSLGIHYAQGYAIHRPEPVAALEASLDAAIRHVEAS